MKFLFYLKKEAAARQNILSRSGNSGFTIIEIVIVIFLTSILLLGLFSLYEWHATMYNYEEITVRVAESGRNAMQAMYANTAQAYRVLATSTVNSTLYSSGPSTLVLQIPAIDSSSNIVVGKWDYAAFHSSGTNLYMDISADAASSRKKVVGKLLSDSLYSLNFTYDDSNFTLVKKVVVDLQNRLTQRNRTVNNRLQQSFYLKNY
jgi:Tfp pilus assembly protein PilV